MDIYAHIDWIHDDNYGLYIGTDPIRARVLVGSLGNAAHDTWTAKSMENAIRSLLNDKKDWLLNYKMKMSDTIVVYPKVLKNEQFIGLKWQPKSGDTTRDKSKRATLRIERPNNDQKKPYGLYMESTLKAQLCGKIQTPQDVETAVFAALNKCKISPDIETVEVLPTTLHYDRGPENTHTVEFKGLEHKLQNKQPIIHKSTGYIPGGIGVHIIRDGEACNDHYMIYIYNCTYIYNWNMGTIIPSKAPISEIEKQIEQAVLEHNNYKCNAAPPPRSYNVYRVDVPINLARDYEAIGGYHLTVDS